MDARLARPEFWAAHYYLLLGTEERDAEDFVEPFFGVTYQQMRDFWNSELEHPDNEVDVLACEVVDDAAVGVEYADCGDDGSEIRFYITDEERSDWELLGYDSPHFALPAFRWEEVNLLGTLNPIAFLLLLPATAWPGTAEAFGVVQHAWQSHPHIQVAGADELAQQIADHLFPAIELRWWQDPDLGWINDGIYSLRNPTTRMCKFDKQRFDRVNEFFGLVGGLTSR